MTDVTSMPMSRSEVPDLGPTTADRLRQFVERIERVQEEKDALTADMRDIYNEAAGVGFDKKALRMIIKKRKKSKSEREEEEAILATYEVALGMV